MSCDHNRAKFFEIMAASGLVATDALERAFQQNRRVPASDAERLSAEAKTRLLFASIAAQGLKPPTHSADGLPRLDARPGYAAVFDLLRQQGLLGETERMRGLSMASAAPVDPAGRIVRGVDDDDPGPPGQRGCVRARWSRHPGPTGQGSLR